MLVCERLSDRTAIKEYSTKLVAVEPGPQTSLLQIQSFLRVGLVNEAAAKLKEFHL